MHSTDTHGYTELIFGVSHLLGIAFAPRLKNIHKQYIYGFSSRYTYKKNGYALLPSRTINQNLILQHWDDILRFIATIATRHTSASQLFMRLSSYANDHPLYKAVFDKVRQVKQADIVSNKRLGTVLQTVKEQQKVKSIERSKAAPQRRGQKRICTETYRRVNPAALQGE